MNILIVEDENHTAQLLKEMIEANPDRLVIKIMDSIEGTVTFLKKHQAKIDLMFLDIHLADGICFEIFEQIPLNIPVVFCTAYDEYALKAFKANGLDYILKPFKEQDIELAFDKVLSLNEKFKSSQEFKQIVQDHFMPSNKTQTSFLVKLKDKMYPITVKDIALIALENEVVYLYNFKSEKFPVFKTLDQIEEAIDPAAFFRVNRQMFINREAILEIEPYFNRKVVVRLQIPFKEQIIVSRLKVSPFLTWIENA